MNKNGMKNKCFTSKARKTWVFTTFHPFLKETGPELQKQSNSLFGIKDNLWTLDKTTGTKLPYKTNENNSNAVR